MQPPRGGNAKFTSFSPADVFFGVEHPCFLLGVKHPGLSQTCLLPVLSSNTPASCFEFNTPALSQTTHEQDREEVLQPQSNWWYKLRTLTWQAVQQGEVTVCLPDSSQRGCSRSDLGAHTARGTPGAPHSAQYPKHLGLYRAFSMQR